MTDGSEVTRLKLALAGLLAERNVWARQLADTYDERDAARANAERLRVAAAWRENVILKVAALLYEWERLGRGDGIHGRQLREVIKSHEEHAEPLP